MISAVNSIDTNKSHPSFGTSHRVLVPGKNVSVALQDLERFFNYLKIPYTKLDKFENELATSSEDTVKIVSQAGDGFFDVFVKEGATTIPKAEERILASDTLYNFVLTKIKPHF